MIIGGDSDNLFRQFSELNKLNNFDLKLKYAFTLASIKNGITFMAHFYQYHMNEK